MNSLFRSAARRLSPHNPRLLRPYSLAADSQQTPPSPLVSRLVEEVSSLSQSQLCDLCRIIIDKTGQEPPRIAIMGAGAGVGMRAGAAGPAKEAEQVEEKKEKTVFELKLEAFDAASKIKVIKEVRSFTDLGLKEAKELVEKAPVVIKGGISKEDGMAIVEKMKAVGAKVVLE